uniref:Uncharacterized protein n=1 Tax=Solanum lycopersicum TaxID=4081 RepID=A0A3Q7HR98_SOLLC
MKSPFVNPVLGLLKSRPYKSEVQFFCSALFFHCLQNPSPQIPQGSVLRLREEIAVSENLGLIARSECDLKFLPGFVRPCQEYFFNELDEFMENVSKKCFKIRLYVVTNLVKETFRDVKPEK